MEQTINQYPLLEIDLKKLRNNIEQVVNRCGEAGIEVAGVIKGFNGIPQVAEQFKLGGCRYIASSRLEQIEDAKNYGIEGPFMLIRIAMPSELERLVSLADYSLQSEVSVIDALNEECIRQNKKHHVILMADLGDLREGFWDKEELAKTALHIEKDLKNIHLLGVGTNLGCYGSIKPTPEKMNELVEVAEKIEETIGRQLEVISGGATSSFTMVHDKTMPSRINHLRIGEGIILAYDLQKDWGYDMSYLNMDAFTLKAQIIEVKDKPTYPVGEIFIDAFGNVCEYEDRGIRRRALLGLGKLDACDLSKLLPRTKNIEILGGSSDHTILDIEDNKDHLQVGDVVEFDVCYTTMLFLTNSKNVTVQCI
ncbi:alanine/ornithine racemase family PLP-dependent enzyme [Sinanaerobacter sp. ZZT-01]|uniref:alanine/ornithine racemase family PLP-dependent enzyme n=1 Tax=Sinanaerobacter sp. ZZT-01 TaxID=3111540 RepID=UPI002D784C29|nr:alanine/ornithine racemase family PLP-dependent enzyme [Sinanaerobacter sp. ZZT-01]WRR94431.1 alanine/ornithine racemase family PLP-dependent enzyme [Sinanaerobacter sp. ZZT-01]